VLDTPRRVAAQAMDGLFLIDGPVEDNPAS